MYKSSMCLVVLTVLCNLTCFAQDKDDFSQEEEVDNIKLSIAIAGHASVFGGGMYLLHNVWYRDVPQVDFHLYRDLKGYNQIDKFGHAYGAYVESYVSYHWFRGTGLSKKKALLLGGPMGLIMQTPIEIFDGIYEGWGFSLSDMVANAMGSALFMGQEWYFDEQVLQYKFSFKPSLYVEMANGYLGDSFFTSLFYDYNGHTYWLSTRANRIFGRKTLPDWLCISAGYSAGGMFGEFENRRFYKGHELPEIQRYRQFLVSFDIDWSKIPTNNKFLKKVFNSMFMVKVPFPAIEFNTLGKVRGHKLYF